jgi:hypothetical protein
MTKALARQRDNLARDTKERIHVLRLQTMAWRHVAVIATADPERGKQLARWLLSKTLPFTHCEDVQKFIAESESEAEQAGLSSGIFDLSTIPKISA